MKKELGLMDTLSGVMSVLRERGYKVDFNADPCKDDLEKYPEKFKIVRVYRFEGTTDPQDEAVLYAIESKTSGIKGVLLNGYGVYSDAATNDLIAKLHFEEDEKLDLL